MGINRLGFGIAGTTSTVKTERRNGCLADDVRASVEKPGDDCGILPGHKTFHDRRTIHHRDACQSDVIF